MTTGTVAAIILAALVAGGLAYFQYFYKAGNAGSVHRILALLRFVAIFGLLALLINPVMTRNTYETEKIPLPIVLDNSGSIKELGAAKTALEAFDAISKNSGLAEKFAVETFQFDSEMLPFEKVDFNGRQTNPDAIAKALKGLYRNQKFPAILITDGNQTQGSDYVHSFGQAKVFPIAVGDTIEHPDLKITRLNVNKYAFLKNQFPVEVFLNYSGQVPVTAQFAISQGASVLARQSVSFSPDDRTKVVNLLLPAQKSGVQQYAAVISSSLAEKNKYNNSKRFAVEVMDQKTEVALVSSIAHPDLGALRRSIESNAQRKVTILKPNELRDLSTYNILILYQPNGSFKPIYDLNKTAGINTFTITGMATDYDFLNREQSILSFRNSGQPEDYQGSFEANFNLFALDDIGFNRFPPLEKPFGTVSVKENVNTLLSATVRNIPANAPLLTFTENQNRRSAYLLGENIWKWRMHLHAQESSFEKFDLFLDKTIQFLATTAIRKSLVVNHERFYNSGDAIEITAQYFNKNYELDQSARLSITVTNKNTKQARKYDMLKGSNALRANLDGLPAGAYQFSVRELNSNAVYNGSFEVLDFDIEKQFVNADWQRLKQLADVSGGKAIVASQAEQLIKTLVEDDQYKPIQKKVSRKSPLIDWIWLLAIIAAALGVEWFVRKYNGML